MMRQAVLALVHHPKIATRLQAPELDIVATLDEAGADILRSLIADLRDNPCANTGQLLERWRDRPEHERFARLASVESLVPGDEAALLELRDALGRLQEEQRRRRLDALIERERAAGLSSDEKLELQQLMASRNGGRGGGATR